MIKKAIATLLSIVIVLAASPVSAAPGLVDNSCIVPSMQSLEKEDFIRIAKAGFNDPMNNYAFSMTEFNGDVYVGTNRNFLCRIFEVLKEVDVIPPDYEFTIFTCAAGEPWSYERAQDMCAEIWRYRDTEWELVYRSEPKAEAAITEELQLLRKDFINPGADKEKILRKKIL